MEENKREVMKATEDICRVVRKEVGSLWTIGLDEELKG